MQINVNGQTYQRWEDVPDDVRATLLAKLPDVDGNGVPDFLEGGPLPTTGHATVANTHFSVDGETYTSAADLPPVVRQALQQAGLGSFLEATTNAPAPTTPPQQPPRQMLLNGEPVDSATVVGGEPKRWWQFWR